MHKLHDTIGHRLAPLIPSLLWRSVAAILLGSLDGPSEPRGIAADPRIVVLARLSVVPLLPSHSLAIARAVAEQPGPPCASRAGA